MNRGSNINMLNNMICKGSYRSSDMGILIDTIEFGDTKYNNMIGVEQISRIMDSLYIYIITTSFI